jgi:hypothetical protein
MGGSAVNKIRSGELIGSWLFYVMSLITIFAPCLYKSVFARSIFELEATVDGQTETESFDNIFDFIRGLDTGEIKSLIPTYTDTSSLNAVLDIRGLKATGRFRENSPTLVLDIPSIRIHEVFRGETRDDSVDLFVDWLKKEGGGTLSKLMRGFIAETPNDPIAGNPHSLMANLVSADFDRAFSTSTTGEIETTETTTTGTSKEGVSEETPKEITYSNLMALSPRFGSLRQGDLDNRQITLPLSYTIRFNSDPRYKLTFSMPITWIEVDGANSYSAALGVGFTFPVMDRWSLTPAVNYGGVGSLDLGSLAQIVSGSLTSIYSIPINKYTIRIGNMGGYYRTLELPFDFSGFDPGLLDPNIGNTVFRNGVMVSIPTESLLKNTALELFFADTRYFGSALFIDNYQEIGFAYGFNKTERKTIKDKIKNYLKDLRGGATYLYADESEGYTVNFGYTF